jgi:hypothetical protein
MLENRSDNVIAGDADVPAIAAMIGGRIGLHPSGWTGKKAVN